MDLENHVCIDAETDYSFPLEYGNYISKLKITQNSSYYNMEDLPSYQNSPRTFKHLIYVL